ncbi:DUF4917 family protein [Geovibrio ferrireducens]|uniref:DUF4917 family protein n=1 Tax=Geovibrio ferrireducens TaxID=46201 RepID=UPI0022462EDD|nr:DUF4917 family protein [Geovibrio ferrireducens]
MSKTETGLMTFEEALKATEGQRRSLLMGNGFSIAYSSKIFNYRALFDSADFSERKELKKLFEVINTTDFELVIKTLLDSISVVRAFFPKKKDDIKTYSDSAEWLKKQLVEVLTKNHPNKSVSVDDLKYSSCKFFLEHFVRFYTLNYDLLLYWTFMKFSQELKPQDGFGGSDDDDCVYWTGSHESNVHYLHGALHLFDDGSRIRKITFNRTGIALRDQIEQSLQNNEFPIFVSEGTSEQKLEKIIHNAYLHKCLRSLKSISRTLFIYGMSFSENDQHVINAILESKVTDIYVSIYGNKDDENNKKIIDRVFLLEEERNTYNSKCGGRSKLKINLYDAASAHVWDRHDILKRSSCFQSKTRNPNAR